MSDKEPPRNPFGGGERTVIVRPNPGGRREQPPPAPPPPVPPPPPADIWGTGNPAAAPSYHPPPADVWGTGRPAAPPPSPSYQQPSQGPAQPGYSPPPASAGPPLDLGFDTQPQVPGPNPIMQAARPLLLLIGSLRLTANSMRVAPLMDAIAQEIQAIERGLGQLGVPAEQVKVAKYAVCATTDDIVQHLPGSDRLLWTQYSMVSRFFGATTSGVGFFDELNRAKLHPTANGDLLELMHACLSLGFQGQYRASAGGDVALQQVRRDLFQTLRTFRPPPEEDISPHWRGQDIKAPYMQARLPVWVAASGAAGLLAAVFIGLRILLGTSTDALADRLAGLHPQAEVRIERTVYKPLPPVQVAVSTQMQRVRDRLAADIAAGRLTISEVAGKIDVKLMTDAMFKTASADVNKDYAPVIEHVAAALDSEPKEISVVGHTDNAKIKSRLRFKDNQQLSEERAKAVAAIMTPKLKDQTRIVTSGRGPDEPIQPNDSEKNRALNRRVEIFLPRTGP